MDSKEVRKIASLACLTLTEDEIESMQNALTDILNLVGQLQEHDMGSTPPVTHPLEMVQRMREDEITETEQRRPLQASASAVADGFYLVPQVIEHGN